MAEREVDTVFIIADLAGYTALTEAHGHRQRSDISGSELSHIMSVRRSALQGGRP
jgi:hypothetical protein